MQGIYKILNKETGHYYIGSSKNIKERWARHIKRLKSNKHRNIILQNSWNKYGQNSFDFIIIENIDDISILLEREQYYLDKLKPKFNIGKKS